MSYFDNANNQVTRKSFGSKVDKEFKREGVIPVRDRSKKNNSLEEAAAKYKDLNKQVDARRLKDLKEQKAFDTKMKEGFVNLKEELIRDFISEICIESLLVDKEVVNENFKNIVEMVERQVDDIGGFDGVKRIAETYNNPILKSMVNICEATAKKVGERNMKEAKNDSSKVDYGLNKVELEEYDYRKKEMGVDTIVNNIKDKVFQVVQDEQKMNTDKQMVMDEIQNKVSELEAPVEEAMSFIFDSKIEEDTLFNSLMRSHYKQLLESNSSAIFESFDYKDLGDPLFENEEFDMSDVDMQDIDDEDKDEIEDMFLNEAKVLYDAEDYEFEELLENFYKLFLEGSENIKSYAQAKHFKSLVRKAQNELEYVEEKCIRNIQKHARKISDKKLDKSITQWEREIEETRAKIKREKDPVCLDDYKEDLRTLEAELKALKSEKSHRGKQLKIAREANPYMKPTTESIDDIKNKLNSMAETADASDGDVAGMPKKEMTEKDLKSSKSVSEEVILCPTCGKEECTCKVAKESDDPQNHLIEQYINKLEEICESMNVIVESHETARNNVIDSLNKNIHNELTFVPYIQANDVNLNNLEFIYKTKIVCESLKDNLRFIETKQEADTLRKAVDMNIVSISETLDMIGSREDMNYKIKILNAGKKYLSKINNVLEKNSERYEDIVVESNNIYSSADDVERIFNIAKEYYAIESTNKDVMELVMAEAIVDYTILETFNTLYLMKFDKNTVRQMSRKNISK